MDGRRAMAADGAAAFRGRHFTAEVILWALRWYLAFPISYRDFGELRRATRSLPI